MTPVELTKTQVKVIDRAIKGLGEIDKTLKEYLKNHVSYPYIQSYGFVFKDLTTTNIDLDGYCLGPWRRIGDYPVAMYQRPHPPVGSNAELVGKFRKGWIDYMFDRKISPWRNFIKWGTYNQVGQHIYDPEFVSNVGYIHYTNDPITNVAHIMVALRDPYEHPDRVNLWWRLTQEGVDPAVALVFTRNYSVTDARDVPRHVLPIDDNTKIAPSWISHTHIEYSKHFDDWVGLMKQLKAATPTQPDNNGTLFSSLQYSLGNSISKLYYSNPYRPGGNIQDKLAKYLDTGKVINHASLVPMKVDTGVLTFSRAVKMLKAIEKEYDI